jgi:hypothetical protein
MKARSEMKRILGLALGAGFLMALIYGRTLAGEPVLRGLQFRDDFDSGDLSSWEFPHPEDWVIQAEGGNRFLHMLRPREPGVPRRPLQFARLKKANVGSFEFAARVRREAGSMIVVFNYVDTLHFYYAHLSVDQGTQQPVHNGLFIVNGEPRRRLAGLEAAPALPDKDWHEVRIRRNARSGHIEVFMDGEKAPRFSVQDRTFNCGQIGIGSFAETGDFDDIRLTSNDAGCEPGEILRPAAATQ